MRAPCLTYVGREGFDTEIIIQLVLAQLRIKELAIPTYYGDEISRVNGLKYAWDVTTAVLTARLQEVGLLYDPRFDCVPDRPPNDLYRIKSGYLSPQTACLGRVKRGTRVLDIGCANPYMSALLKDRNHCSVTGVAVSPRKPGVNLDRFIPHDLNAGAPAVQFDDYDYVLMLDVLEHLASPEDFIGSLKGGMSMAPDTELLVSTANVGFFIPRLMLSLGQFNYGKRGILDMTHTRLFTFRSLRRLFEQAGFQVIEEQGIPGPFPLAIGDNRVSRFLLWVNRALMRLSRGVFSYQIFMVVKPLPSLEYLLRAAYENRGGAVETG